MRKSISRILIFRAKKNLSEKQEVDSTAFKSHKKIANITPLLTSFSPFLEGKNKTNNIYTFLMGSALSPSMILGKPKLNGVTPLITHPLPTSSTTLLDLF